MRGKMYDDEYSVSYDFRDYEDEERSEWIPVEIEELSKCEDNESFIESVKNYNRKYGPRKLPSEPKREPKDFADGLREFVQSKAGRPISELYDKNVGDDDVDVKQLFEEIEAERDKILEEELKNPEYWEKAKQEAVEIYSQIPMYDFGLGQMSNEHEMSKFYGQDLVNRIRAEIRESCNLPDHIRETGQISKELWQELRDIRAGKRPNSKSTIKKKNNCNKISEPTKTKKKESKEIKIAQRERQPGDDYYMITERGVIRNSSYRKFFQGRGIVYEWLWANLVRGEWIDTKGYPIKEKYFDKGFLAYCSSPEKIGNDCGGMSKNTVEKYIKEFEEAGIIKVDYLVRKGNTKGQRVYILGTWKKVKVREDGKWKDKIVERFYRDEIFLSEKNGQNMTD